MSRGLVAGCLALCLVVAGAPVAMSASAPTEWDNLVKVPSKRFQHVYLLPGADFKPYTKVMLDPAEAAFEKNFVRDYNSSSRGLSQRITSDKAAKALDQVRTGVNQIFAKAYTDAGYQVVTAPGPDVLRLRLGVVNLYVNAVDTQSAGRTRSYAPEAGRATMFIEARDSMTGAILGRAVDGQLAGDMGPWIRNSVTNRADFSRLFQTWAKDSVKGLSALKAEPSPAGKG
jgi:hypothetical protein